VRLHVVSEEDGDADPFLLVHGLSSNLRTWEGVVARLHELGHPVAAVDLRGHGRSPKPDGGYDLGTMAEDLVAVLDDLGFERAVIAGQSTGGNIAVELGVRHPERVAGMVGVDGGSIELSRQFPEWDACESVMAPPRLAGTPAASVEGWIRRGHPDWSDWAVSATMANLEVLPDGTIRPWLTFERHLQILRSLWEHRPSVLVPRLEAPLLLALADSGDAWAEDKRALADELVGSSPLVRVEWFSPGDHDLHLQFPTELAELLHGSF
jgi:pimeloyl-ACP methyl ester carboxylesterase